jgi:ABC-type methionine transport system ATPase subunit
VIQTAGGYEDPDLAEAFSLRRVRQEKRGTLVLDDVELVIPKRKVTALIGPSGAGKTSLIRLLNRLDDPVRGEILYCSQPIVTYPVRALRSRVGFVFQTPVLFPGTVRENLHEAAQLAGVPSSEFEPRAEEAMRLAELELALLDRDGSRLSLGQQQRAALARTLMTSPEVLLMDEPTSALDPETADHLVDTIHRLSEERGLTVVMVTHRLGEARRGSDHAVLLERGRVVEAGATPELFADSAQARTRAFLHAERES